MKPMDRWGPMPTVRCAEMGTTTRSRKEARAPSDSTATHAAAQATPPPPPGAPPLAPLAPLAGGSREGARGQSPGGGGGVPFQGKRASNSRRNSAQHVVKAPQVPPESLKRTWGYVARMDEDGVTDALLGPDAEIIPLPDLKGEHLNGLDRATKRFEVNDLYELVCKRALARMKQYGVLDDSAPSDERDGPRCKCGARMIVHLSDAVQYWVDETNPGTSPYFTSTEAGAADAARRGWRRIQPKHHHGPAAKVAANAPAAVENVYREDGVEGCFSGYLPTFNRETLVAAVRDGFVNPETGAPHAPLRLWTLERRQMAWSKAGLVGGAVKTIGKRFNALLAMYWALTHDRQLSDKFGLTPLAGAKKLEEAGGKMMSALGKSRFDLVSEHATGVVRARPTTAL